jgi:glycosyltransferase involved in cell wall biosynthesis
MAAGIPVVLTPVIAAAIPELVSGTNCLIADGAAAIAGSVIALIEDSRLRQTIAQTGYELMKRSYSWNERLSGYELLDAM